jgi:ferredoxin
VDVQNQGIAPERFHHGRQDGCVVFILVIEERSQVSDKLRVTIDRAECIMCGACYATCPDFFEESPDDGLSQVILSYQVAGDPAVGEVPAEMQDCVREAAEGCPVEIIHVA